MLPGTANRRIRNSHFYHTGPSEEDIVMRPVTLPARFRGTTSDILNATIECG